MTRTGAGTPTQIQRLYQPEDYRSGNEVNVSIAPVAGATAYQVWISAYENGRGARPVNARAVDGQVTEVQVCGLQPSIPFYFFVSYTDADGNSSKPSQAVRTVLVNEWPMQLKKYDYDKVSSECPPDNQRSAPSPVYGVRW